ncbi:MAG TPA: tRNA uridine-5-carboxymethylaminomethyl(34) synthesis enzyme MnmG [Erysipelotrichaceae bacterium]|nr:tRNA uridine-5-carboxymethylaminomethyl(34) synthesis enzyme MnmG [Erysipelotrichaceae bacterium]
MFDIIVIGAGHAGVEAALAAARMGKKTAVITMNVNKTAMMPCNPSVGGPAKGIVVREIDALGGQMGITADKTALQFKMLNTNKGPGVQSLRVQSDKLAYSEMMKECILNQENLTVIEAMVERLLINQKVIEGVVLKDATIVNAKAVILTTGTYMSSKIMISDEVTENGPDNEPTTNTLSQSIRDAGFTTFRLKTGTPPRVKTASIDFSKTTIQPGDEKLQFFSSVTTEDQVIQEQYPCYLTYTAAATHEMIHLNLHRSSMYSGVVEGVGPRYCPSIEDKIVRFADKDRHQIFLEPQSARLDTTYVQGFSTSLPKEVQDKMIRTIPGLENCEISEYAYAIEYDAIDPTQLYPTLETRIIKNLYTAGQINGTSGYEEAAGQGIMAAINAALKLDQRPPLILRRDEAYIGVMIDDLITKGTLEPYRLLTSRAEYRLLLRHDNAESRLSAYGHQVGLLKDERYDAFVQATKMKDLLMEQLKTRRITKKDELYQLLVSKGYPQLNEGLSYHDAIKRPHIEISDFLPYLDVQVDAKVAHQTQVEIKYEGYIVKARKEADKLRSVDELSIPEDINYDDVLHLSIEGRQKLTKIRPLTIGQASRISGVSPADVTNVLMTIKSRVRK